MASAQGQTKNSRFRVGEIWEGPSGGIWHVTHLTSDGFVQMRSDSEHMRTLIRSSVVPRNWTRLSAASRRPRSKE